MTSNRLEANKGFAAGGAEDGGQEPAPNVFGWGAMEELSEFRQRRLPCSMCQLPHQLLASDFPRSHLVESVGDISQAARHETMLNRHDLSLFQ